MKRIFTSMLRVASKLDTVLFRRVVLLTSLRRKTHRLRTAVFGCSYTSTEEHVPLCCPHLCSACKKTIKIVEQCLPFSGLTMFVNFAPHFLPDTDHRLELNTKKALDLSRELHLPLSMFHFLHRIESFLKSLHRPLL